MAIFIILLLGIIQGAAEFLPISSSGHLVVFYNIFKISDNTILLSVLLHTATLLAVVVYYRKQFVKLILKPFCQTNIKLLISTIITLICVLCTKSIIESSFSNNFVIYGFLITAILLTVTQLKSDKMVNYCIDAYDITDMDVTYFQAIVIGFSQGLGVFPGISRSGSTICAGLISGVKRHNVADFSFLLSVPIISASLIYELFKLNNTQTQIVFNIWQLIAGFSVAFVVGLLCIKIMIRVITKFSLIWFAFYLFLLSVFLMFNTYVLNWF